MSLKLSLHRPRKDILSSSIHSLTKRVFHSKYGKYDDAEGLLEGSTGRINSESDWGVDSKHFNDFANSRPGESSALHVLESESSDSSDSDMSVHDAPNTESIVLTLIKADRENKEATKRANEVVTTPTKERKTRKPGKSKERAGQPKSRKNSSGHKSDSSISRSPRKERRVSAHRPVQEVGKDSGGKNPGTSDRGPHSRPEKKPEKSLKDIYGDSISSLRSGEGVSNKLRSSLEDSLRDFYADSRSSLQDDKSLSNEKSLNEIYSKSVSSLYDRRSSKGLGHNSWSTLSALTKADSVSKEALRKMSRHPPSPSKRIKARDYRHPAEGESKGRAAPSDRGVSGSKSADFLEMMLSETARSPIREVAWTRSCDQLHTMSNHRSAPIDCQFNEKPIKTKSESDEFLKNAACLRDFNNGTARFPKIERSKSNDELRPTSFHTFRDKDRATNCMKASATVHGSPTRSRRIRTKSRSGRLFAATSA